MPTKSPASQPSGVVQSAWEQLKAKGLAVAISKTEAPAPALAEPQLPVSASQSQTAQKEEGGDDAMGSAADPFVVEDDCDVDLVHKLEAAHEMCVEQFGESSALATVALRELQQARDKARKEKPLTSRLHLAARKVEQLEAKIHKTEKRVHEQKEEVGKAVAKLHSEEELLAAQQEKLRQAKDEYVDLAGVAAAKPDVDGNGDDVRKAWTCLGVPLALLDSQDDEVRSLLDSLQRSVQALQQKLPQEQPADPASGAAQAPQQQERGRTQETAHDERSAEDRSRSRERRLAEQKAKEENPAEAKEPPPKQPRL